MLRTSSVLSRSGLRPSTIPSLHTTTSTPFQPHRSVVYLATPTKEAIRKAKLAASFPQPSSTSKYPPSKPPSHKPGEFSRSQMLRSYVSLVRSSPLLLFFQHNNLTSGEWMGVRRELGAAMAAVDAKLAKQAVERGVDSAAALPTPLADKIRISVVKASMMLQAVRLVDFYHPDTINNAAVAAIGKGAAAERAVEEEMFTHYLSSHARDVVKESPEHGLKPVMSGPTCVLSFPSLSPAYVEAGMRILAPRQPDFAAPRKRERPGLYDPVVQAGLQKLVFLGGRVWEWRTAAAGPATEMAPAVATQPRVIDPWETRDLARLPDIETLRAQLAATLNLPASSLASALSSSAVSLGATLEGRRQMLEDEAKPAEA